MQTRLPLKILSQPDDVTCGPTCLHSVYQYYSRKINLNRVIKDVQGLDAGGTLGVFLGIDALKNNFKATMYTYNLRLFDPTWFFPGVDLHEKLNLQMKRKAGKKKLITASRGYLKFLELGGKIKYEDLTGKLIRKFLISGTPVLTGLSATYLYGTPREIGETNEYDDLGGEASGHFVVLCGYDKIEKKVTVADPLFPNPRFKSQYYQVSVNHLISSILLGILTYDSNLLVIEPK